jgi:putative transcriptional regulator
MEYPFIPGQFLAATSLLDGTYFQDAVIFLAQASESSGAYGFIINRARLMPVNEIFNGVPKTSWRPIQIHLSGPVLDSEIHLLQLGSSAVEGAHEVVSGVWLGGDFSATETFLDHVLRQPRVWVMMGYSGWAPQQLEKEVDEGCWKIVTIDPTLVFSENPRGFGGSAPQFLEHYGSFD